MNFTVLAMWSPRERYLPARNSVQPAVDRIDFYIPGVLSRRHRPPAQAIQAIQAKSQAIQAVVQAVQAPWAIQATPRPGLNKKACWEHWSDSDNDSSGGSNFYEMGIGYVATLKGSVLMIRRRMAILLMPMAHGWPQV